jgi:hypothetical protein
MDHRMRHLASVVAVLLSLLPSSRARAATAATEPPGAGPGATTMEPAGSGRARDEIDGPPVLLRSKARLGGYGGVSVAYSRMLGRDGVLLGGEGALLLDHRFSVGLAAYGFTRTPRGPNDAFGGSQEFATGYGGVSLHYFLLTELPLCFSFGAIIGGGALTLGPDPREDSREVRRDDLSVDAFFVIQPEVGAHATITRWLRVGATAGYRLVSGVSRFGFEESDLDAVVLGTNLQLGWL